VELRDGRTLRFAGVPLPDGNGLLTVLDITDSQMAEKALRDRAKARKDQPARETLYGAGALWKYAQLVGSTKDGAVTHPGKAGERHVYADL
ncbi:MAG: histidine kinase, partial [Pseudomonadota bacterium]